MFGDYQCGQSPIHKGRNNHYSTRVLDLRMILESILVGIRLISNVTDQGSYARRLSSCRYTLEVRHIYFTYDSEGFRS